MVKEVDLYAVLAARERRAQCQQALLAAYERPLLCFTMNIAGPRKRSSLIDRGFALGLQRLEDQLRCTETMVLHWQVEHFDTGCEAYLVTDLPAAKLKALAVEIEEMDELGRLFDMDVLTPSGEKLERTAQRGCLICGKEGRGCARSRAHAVEELQRRTEEILTRALQEHERQVLGELACRALLYEACTAPKPGLVDRFGSGSHEDMDIFTFMSSAAALQPYFVRCAAVGQDTAHLSPQETLAALRLPGKLAEGRMYRATGGVNTHKGAVFVMGLLCGALGRLDRAVRTDPAAVLAECGRMAVGLTKELGAEHDRTEGQRFFALHGIRGIRGEAEDGFPTVREKGLPALERALAAGKPLEEAGCEALLALMTATEDTALLHRAGWDGWQETKNRAAQVLEQGVTRGQLEQMDRELREKRYSPGGSADLLSVCYLLHFLKETWEE